MWPDNKVLQMKVIYEDNHLLVVEKPVNVPMQEDSSKDKDLLTMAKEYIKKKYDKPGDVYLGLVHRLDRPVGGICVFARTSKAASRLSEAIRKNEFHKVYLAVVEDNCLEDKGHFEDKLLKDHRTNMVRVSDDGKLAILDYEVLKRKDNLALVKVYLKTGRSHQIRVQFSSRNHPLYGDQRYNKNAGNHEQIALYSHSLSFIHPVTKEELSFTLTPDYYPFNI